MPRILVVDDEVHVREVLRRSLSQWGYEVVEAENGSVALEKFNQTLPEVVLLDVTMPVMNGFEALKNLRQSPSGADMPVVLVTTLPPAQGEPVAVLLGCQHYVSKPFDFDVLKSTIRVAVREAEMLKAAAPEPSLEYHGQSEPPQPARNGFFEPGVLRIGIELIDGDLGGGIPRYSVTLIEGPAGAGKSVLCQHLAHQILQGQGSLSYIFSEGSESNLIARTSSIGLMLSSYHRQGQLQINCVKEPVLGENSEQALFLLCQQLRQPLQPCETVIVDSITSLATYCEEKSLISFFQLCKDQSRHGWTICLVTQSGVFEENLWVRLYPLLDNHIKLSFKPMGRKLVKTLEVLKVNNTAVSTGNRIAFEVQNRTGILATRLSELTV